MRAKEITEPPKRVKGGLQIFELDEKSRAHLAGIFPPKFPEFIGHHISIRHAKSDVPLPEAKDIKVIGYACDDAGIEALLVSVDGTTTRPDGKTYHITWSLDRDAGFKPVNSNDLLARVTPERVNPINITATAMFF